MKNRSSRFSRYRRALTAFGSVAFLSGAAFLVMNVVDAQRRTLIKGTPAAAQKPSVYQPEKRGIDHGSTVNFAEVAKRDAKVNYNRPFAADNDGPGGKPDGMQGFGVAKAKIAETAPQAVTAPTPSVTGISAPPTQTFKGEYLSGTTIPPDTHGAVGNQYIVTVSNNQFRIQDRNGVEVSRATINSFWSGTQIKGTNVTSAFDTKAFFDRFNNRFIIVSSLNGPGQFSGMGVAVSQTNNPTGVWNRYTAASDPASTTTGHAIDYPSVGFNQNWIVVNENTFNYSGSAFTTYWGQQIFVFDKQAAYAGTLGSISLFQAAFNDSTVNTPCNSSATPQFELACGFTMAPSVNEENNTPNMYLAEDWDNVAGQLRVSKISGTPAAPVLTVGTQFPQSPFSWQFSAARIGTTNNCGGTCSGGYAPMRQQSANLPSSTRIMTNDSRIQNLVYRAGSLWATHTVMLANTPTPAGTGFSTTNPDTHSAVQWWQMDPTVETGLASVPTQRARIEDSTADNCHNGAGGTRADATCNSTALQKGTFFAYPNISVNATNDVFIGFTQFSPLTYPSAAYAIRRSGDLPNTMRDPVVYRGGQGNYNIGSGSGTSRQNRWGDYSLSQTDPTDDTTFWTVQEYAGTYRQDFLNPSIAGPWETWWAKVNAATAAATTTGNLIISEFRLRGPQGANDEFVELYNPSNTPLYVSTTDNSDGWSLAYSSNGTTVTGVAVIPNGTVIPARGHYLITRNPDSANAVTVTYSLNGYPGAAVPVAQPGTVLRGADGDNGYAIDNPDNGGFAIFKTANTANFSAATRMDSVGFSTIAAGLFKEGNGIPAIAATTPAGQFAFYRDLTTGSAKDTDVNENDFIFVDPVNEAFTVQPRLGAAGPENTDSPVVRNSTQLRNFALSQPTGSAPNQVQDPTPVPNGPNGTVLIRRTLVNNTGQPITRLRFRLVSTSTLNGPGGSTLDLRLIDSADTTISTTDPGQCGGAPPCNVVVRGTVVEQPPTQALGGGWNSSATTAAVTLATPIAAGGKMNVQFWFGVAAGTPFTDAALAAIPVTIVAETLVPNAAAVPTAAGVSVSGRVVSSTGAGLRGATVTLMKEDGSIVSVTTNSFGYYTFQDVTAGRSYMLGARVKGYTFQSRLIQVTDTLTDVDLVAN
jgi:hypothetical protein